MRTPILLAVLLALSSTARADQLLEPSSELKFEKAPTVDGKPYLCLGTGIRKKAIFRVYAMVFCVEDAAGRAEIAKWFEGAGKKHAALKGDALAEALAEDGGLFKHLMTMPVARYAELIFVRDVSREKMRDAFVESLTRSLGTSEKARIDRFVGLLERDIKEKEHLKIRTGTGGEIEVALDQPKALTDEKLAGAVWEAYLGRNSVAPKLKESVARGVAALRP